MPALGHAPAVEWTAMAWNTEHVSPQQDSSESRNSRAHRGRKWRTLQQRSDFLRVRAAGLRKVMPGFVLQAAQNPNRIDTPGSNALWVGFTVSKKVGNAVCRNRAKRRLRALADRVMADAADANFDYVLIGRTETLTRNFAQMEQDLRKALRRIISPKERGNPSQDIPVASC